MRCAVCPRRCGVDRRIAKGCCGMGERVVVAKAFLHAFEEPVISGCRGSGTVFFSGCSLKCIYCQNHPISHDRYGKEIDLNRLSEIFLELQQQGAHNINLVNPTHFTEMVAEAIQKVKDRLRIPIIWNSSGYELAASLRMLKGLVDVYLPDLKYFSSRLSGLYSGAEDYFSHASEAILEMYGQAGGVRLNHQGLIQKGLIIRHLVIPNCSHDSLKVLDWIRKNLPSDVYISLMSQYTPTEKTLAVKGLNRRLNQKEYDLVVRKLFDLGLTNGFVQDPDSASLKYTPVFDQSGV